MKRRGATALLLGAAIIVLGLLATFAVGLSDNQASSKRDTEARVHERAALAAALINTLFSDIQQEIPADAKLYGTPRISSALLAKQRGTAEYLAVLGPDGSVLAQSGLTSHLRAQLDGTRALKLAQRGAPYVIGDLLPGSKPAVLDVVAALPTAYGRRLLVQGAPASDITTLLAGELDRIPGVAGSRNLILDANDTVIASNLASRPTGYRYRNHVARSGLGVSSGDRDGRYYDEVPLKDTTWRIVLESPDGTLFASLSGLHKWVPWLLLIAFGLVALVALGFGWRMVYSAEQDLAEANVQLGAVNSQLEATNARLERRAEELARSNAELDQFASIASHDLQEPLRKVRTFTEQLMVSESGRLSERGEDYLARANRAAERMQQLIQDLLQFSRVTTKPRPFAPVDLNQVTAEILDDISVELEQSDALVSVGTLPTLSADELQMRQLILNLLSNAVKFRRDGVRPEVSISAETSGGKATIVVADNGTGFEQQYAERIFRVFERLNGRGEYPGTGIGLALCQKITTRHGGRIVAEGRPGEGATFTVTLPLVQRNRPVDEIELNPYAEEETYVAG
ncbi:MAG: sensor histidine kinase [Solirubrobacteraceae bacterium]